MDIERLRKYIILQITDISRIISIKTKQQKSLFEEFEKDLSSRALYTIKSNNEILLTLFTKLNVYNQILDISKKE